MSNISDIGNVSAQLCKVCERIGSLTGSIEPGEYGPQVGDNLKELYENQLLDEVKHAQFLVLAITNLVDTGEATENNDDADGGSAFAPGDLDSTMKDKNANSPEYREGSKDEPNA